MDEDDDGKLRLEKVKVWDAGPALNHHGHIVFDGFHALGSLILNDFIIRGKLQNGGGIKPTRKLSRISLWFDL